jgi:cysteine-rich repeat protein
MIACDDNNTLSGDGCSADCLIEDNWECEGGN